jgi:hypothetical protein
VKKPVPGRTRSPGALPVLRRLAVASVLIAFTGCGEPGESPADPRAAGRDGGGPSGGGTGGNGGSGPGAGGATGMPDAGSGGGGSAGAAGTGGGAPASGGAGGGTGAGAGGGTGADADPGIPDGGAGTSGGAPDADVDTSIPPDAPPPPPPPWTELSGPGVNVQGGVADSAGGRGQPGGTVNLVSNQDIVLDPGRPVAAAPVVPPVPAGAVAVTSANLGANLTTPGSVRVGDATSGGAETLRTISASAGDLFIEGSLRAGDLGATRQGISLSAPGGTIYVTGTVDTSGAPGSGQAGGPLTLSALRVVITGRLSSSGGDAVTAGGGAGAIRISAGETISIAGSVDAFGGDARGAGAVVGGKGADLTLQAGDAVALAGLIRLRGGAATGLGPEAQGGPAGTLRIGSEGSVQIGGTLDGRGGLATAAVTGGRVTGGAAGSLLVGEAAGVPTAIAVAGPVNAAGGDGHAAGGKGGAFRAEPDRGNVIIAGARAIDVSGGSALSSPGAGGLIWMSPHDDATNGGVTLRGEIFADGGSVRMGGVGAGAPAGRIEIELVPIKGPIQVAASAKLSAVGGRSGGAAVAGGGGQVNLYTNDGDLTMAGTIAVMGGDAPDPGGTGGLGGAVHLWSDVNGNGDRVVSGNLLVARTGLIDASGGNGDIGGSARNDGQSDNVAAFPDEIEKIAIFLDCDNVEGGDTRTWLDNQGRLVARGGARNGSGGDIMYHGIMPDGDDPRPGNIDLSGNGSGSPGDFGSE